MKPLITGSLAYDYLMQTDVPFASRLPARTGDGLSSGEKTFSVAYEAPTLTRNFGGCAGNIAYALRHLGDAPAIMATAGGEDFHLYREYLRGQEISTEQILLLDGFYTAQAYITTDSGGNQFILFHPGATAEAHRQDIAAADAAPLAIVSPNGKQGMLRHCRTLAAQKTPFIFDPGQAVGLFDGDEILECLRLANYVIANGGEFEMMQRAVGKLTREEVIDLTDAFILTHGENGSEIYAGGEVLRVQCVKLGETRDPTGCGDAYRGGLIYALMRGWGWQSAGQFAAVIAGIKAGHGSAQGYELSFAKAAQVYRQIFGETLNEAE